MPADFLQRARLLASGLLVGAPLVCASQAASAMALSTSELNLDASYVGYWNASGFFTQVGFTDNETNSFVSLGTAPAGSSISSAAFGPGAKLYGHTVMQDNYLGVVGDDFYDNSSNAAYGVGFAWTGTLNAPLADGDRIALNYDFTIGLTDNEDSGQASVYWELRAGLFETCCGEPFVPGLYSFTSRVNAVASGSVAGGETIQFQGSAASEALSGYNPESSYQWAVFLTTYWSDPDAFDGNYLFSSGSGDTLTLDIPAHSIDVGLNTAPVPVPGAVWLLGSAALALGARRRRQAA